MTSKSIPGNMQAQAPSSRCKCPSWPRPSSVIFRAGSPFFFLIINFLLLRRKRALVVAFNHRFQNFSRFQSSMKSLHTRLKLKPIECFHSRGQHLCKFIGTKESVCIRKEFSSQRTGLGHQHGRRFIALGHQYGRRDVM